ncbi:MAG: hypothetical protein WBD20_14900 [Pirellulaceae bacterium]
MSKEPTSFVPAKDAPRELPPPPQNMSNVRTVATFDDCLFITRCPTSLLLFQIMSLSTLKPNFSDAKFCDQVIVYRPNQSNPYNPQSRELCCNPCVPPSRWTASLAAPAADTGTGMAIQDSDAVSVEPHSTEVASPEAYFSVR